MLNRFEFIQVHQSYNMLDHLVVHKNVTTVLVVLPMVALALSSLHRNNASRRAFSELDMANAFIATRRGFLGRAGAASL